MARKAEFSINGLSVLAELKKVDRKKIYGWSTIEVFDQNGSKCTLAGLAEGLICILQWGIGQIIII